MPPAGGAGILRDRATMRRPAARGRRLPERVARSPVL